MNGLSCAPSRLQVFLRKDSFLFFSRPPGAASEQRVRQAFPAAHPQDGEKSWLSRREPSSSSGLHERERAAKPKKEVRRLPKNKERHAKCRGWCRFICCLSSTSLWRTQALRFSRGCAQRSMSEKKSNCLPCLPTLSAYVYLYGRVLSLKKKKRLRCVSSATTSDSASMLRRKTGRAKNGISAKVACLSGKPRRPPRRQLQRQHATLADRLSPAEAAD